MKYDAIVIGLGAMGSASIYQLAKRGAKVLGIDMFSPPHSHGSSHGESRITRQAITEGKEYVPLLLRSNEIWKEIEAQTGRKLLLQQGILIVASGKTKILEPTIDAADEYRIEHENLTSTEIAHKFPQFKMQGDEQGYFEPGGGYLRPEECISTQLKLAQQNGADIHTNERFVGYEETDKGVVVETDKTTYLTDKLVLSIGPWINDVLPQKYLSVMKLYRQVLYWFELENEQNRMYESAPVFAWKFGEAPEDFMYGFPSLDGKTIKIASEQFVDAIEDPMALDTDVSEKEIRFMHQTYIAPRLKGVSAKCVKAEACIYTVAPERKFLIDFHPDSSNVIVASPCSGHGFKHSAAIGEVIADMTLGSKTKVDVSAFSFNEIMNQA